MGWPLPFSPVLSFAMDSTLPFFKPRPCETFPRFPWRVIWFHTNTPCTHMHTSAWDALDFPCWPGNTFSMKSFQSPQVSESVIPFFDLNIPITASLALYFMFLFIHMSGQRDVLDHSCLKQSLAYSKHSIFAENTNRGPKSIHFQSTALKGERRKKEKEGGYMLKSLKDEVKNCSNIGKFPWLEK